MRILRRLVALSASQMGVTLVEILVTMVVMGLVVSSLSVLVGAAVRSKMIVSVRTADTATARRTLEWMSERLRNAGLNILPTAQIQPRCRDMVVAQESALRPAADRVFVSGEFLNSDARAGNEVITLGYRLQSGVVMEDRGSCSGPWSPTSARVSDPRITVTQLSFRFYTRGGDEVVVPTNNVEAIRRIRVIAMALTVQGEEGRSGVQRQTFARLIMLRNPRPDSNAGWLNPMETVP